MRALYPYPLTSDEVARLVAVLARHGGTRTLRDLYRRHCFWDAKHLELAAAAGIIRIERRKPATGRPSVVAVLNSDGVNNSPPAKLPRRADLPLGLTWKEQRFLDRFAFRWGTSYFGEGRNGGCAAQAYRAAYGGGRPMRPASARSAASRLLRQPWMRAALIYQRRLGPFGPVYRWPDDMRSADVQWLELLRGLNRKGADWPPCVVAILRSARNFGEASSALCQVAMAVGR
jgi:hypothetical protein